MRATRSTLKIDGNKILNEYPVERKKRSEKEPELTNSESVTSEADRTNKESQGPSDPRSVEKEDQTAITRTSVASAVSDSVTEEKIKDSENIETTEKAQEYRAKINDLKKQVKLIDKELEELGTEQVDTTIEGLEKSESIETLNYVNVVIIEHPSANAESSTDFLQASDNYSQKIDNSPRNSPKSPKIIGKTPPLLEQSTKIERTKKSIKETTPRNNSSNKNADTSLVSSDKLYTPFGTPRVYPKNIKTLLPLRRKLLPSFRLSRNKTDVSPKTKEKLESSVELPRLESMSEDEQNFPEDPDKIGEVPAIDDPVKTPVNSETKEKVNNSPRDEKNSVMVANNQIVSLRDALAVIPEYDGKTTSLRAFLQGCEEAVEMLEPESEQYLVKAVRVKIKGEARRTIHLQSFENIDELATFLKSVFAPPRNLYQLQGELGSIYQKPNESVIAYANRARDLGFQIIEAYELGKTYENEEANMIFRANTQKSLPSCFVNGLKSEIEQRMSQHDDMDDAVKQAVKIERELIARAALRGEKFEDTETKTNKSDKKRSVNVVMVEEPECQLCKKTGHTAKTCSLNKLNKSQTPETAQNTEKKPVPECQICHKLGHSAEKCFKLFPPQNNSAPTINAPMITVCQICYKRGHTADKCFRVFPPSNNKSQLDASENCQLCKNSGHTAATCSRLPQGVRVFSAARDSQVPQGLRYPARPIEKCQICKQDGHSAHICPYRNNHSKSLDQTQPSRTYADVTNNGTCHYCKEPGHFIRDCPKKLAKETNSPGTSGNANGFSGMGAMGETKQREHPIRVIRALDIMNQE